MKNKILIFALVIILILSNISSIALTFLLTRETTQEIIEIPNNQLEITITPTQHESSPSVTQTPEYGDLSPIEVLSEYDQSKRYRIGNLGIVIPDSYRITISDELHAYLIRPIENKYPNYTNAITLTPYNYSKDFGYAAWHPELDKKISIENLDYTKLAQVFGEGGERVDNVRDWLEMSVNYHIFHNSMYINQHLSVSANNVDEPDDFEIFNDFVFTQEGNLLEAEMDNIVSSIKVIH